MKKIVAAITGLTLSVLPLQSQDSVRLYLSKMADLGEIQMEYMDYGGDGPLLIEVQDFHNYYEGPYYNPNSPAFDFLHGLTNEFHVVAPMRRGYGRSTDTKWGYDVATLSEDLLDFMDALGVEKAFLHGRFPGSQEMTWIAEHHPERVQGLIYYNNPIILVECVDYEVVEYFENISVFTPDFNKDKLQRIMGSRAMWRPEFLSDTSARIHLPTLRFINPEFEKLNFNLFMFESGEINLMSEEEWPDREEEQAYIKELLQDSLRYERLHEKLIACNLSEEIEAGMKRTFGKHLITKIELKEHENKTNSDIMTAYFTWQLEHIITFKEKILSE